MEQQCTTKEEPGLHSSVLRLVNSPLRLICATIWRVVQETDVLNYGILEEFLTLMAESVPDLLSQRQWAQLILGLRAKVVLELCRCESSADRETIQRHLDRMQLPVLHSLACDGDVEASESNFLALVDILLSDTVERDIFFQEVFPVEYGPKYDQALQRLTSVFVSRLEQILTIPCIDKLATILSAAPSVMEECFQTLSHPHELLNSLGHLKNHSDTAIKGSSPSLPLEEDGYIFSCLSHPPIVQVVIGGGHKTCDIESSYCEEVSVECEEVSALNTGLQPAGVKIESELREELDKANDGQPGYVYALTNHPQCEETKDGLSKEMATPLVDGPQRSEEAPSIGIKLIGEDGVVVNVQGLAAENRPEGVETTGHGEGLLSAEKPPEEITKSCQIVKDNVLNSICRQRQLTVKLDRINITGKPLPLLRRQSGRVRRKRVMLLWKKNKGPEITWIAPDDEPDTTTKLQHSVTALKMDKSGGKLPAVVYTCSKCSFHDGSEAILHKHLMKTHPEEFSRLLSAGFHQSKLVESQGEQAARASAHPAQPPKRGVASKTCPVCRKIFTRATDMRRHLKSHLTEQLHFCSGCGRCFQEVDDLKRHTADCKDIVPARPIVDPSSLESKEPEGSGHSIERVLVSTGEECNGTQVGQVSSTPEQTGSEAVDPRACPVCCLVLARASDMERHMRSHSAEKPYECLHCAKSYSYPYNLKKHVDMCHQEVNPTVKDGGKHSCDGVQDTKDPGLVLDVLQGNELSKTCPTCKKTFTRATDMRRHQKLHTAGHFECLKCGETFPDSSDLKKHSQNCCPDPADKMQGTLSPKRPLVCGTCGKKFFFLTHFQRHMRVHRQASKPTKRWHKCAKCEEIFRTLYDLGKHQRCHWGDDPLRCTQCGRRFSHSVQLASHKQIHTHASAMKCTMCEETFNETASFRLHYLQAHNIKGSYPCSHCKKTFTEVCPLVRHLRAHTGERPYQCPQCPKSFLTAAKLSMHKRAHGHGGSGPRERQHLCHECGKCFYTAAELKRHEASHRDERPHICPHCGKGFKEPRTLKAHMECHVDSQERLRYPCSYCSKTFIKAGALVRHNRIHTGERPHHCSECNKSFLTHSEVLKHMRFHTGERPFTCQVCNKGFTQSCYLTAHMRTHTGERPYACSVCEKCFADSAHRKRHMLIHTGEKPHVCERCGRAFNRKNLLNVHLKICV